MVERRSDPRTKGRIVAAGFDLIASRGIRALTLDGVACQARLSKGGLLYHFGGKHDLIRAMLRDALERCLQRPTGEAWRALVRALLVAAYMSPRELNRSLPLFYQLRDSLTGGAAGGSTRAETLARAIGTAFLAELGLGAADRGHVPCAEERGGVE